MFYEQFVIDFGSRFYRLNLKNNFTDIIFICVGSNKITGDSLGPIVGAKLKQKLGTNIAIIGTTETPVNYENIKETIKKDLSKILDTRNLSFLIGSGCSLGTNGIPTMKELADCLFEPKADLDEKLKDKVFEAEHIEILERLKIVNP